MSAQETYRACGDVGPSGFACERPRGHDGPHRAKSVNEEWEGGDG